MMGDNAEYSTGDGAISYDYLTFIKLGGSLVSDKTKEETLRREVLDRIVRYDQLVKPSSGIFQTPEVM